MVICPKCGMPFEANKQSSVFVTGSIVVGLDENKMPIIDLTKATSIKPDWLQCEHCNSIIMCNTGDDWYSYQERITNWKPALGHAMHEPTNDQFSKMLHSLNKEQLASLLNNLKQGGGE